MFTVMFLLTLIYFSIINTTNAMTSMPLSPCRSVFSYVRHRHYYYGQMQMPNDGSNEIHLFVNISMQGLYPTPPKIKLKLLTSNEELKSGGEIRFRMDFPFINIIPSVIEIRLNGKVLCTGPEQPLTTSGISYNWATFDYKLHTFTFTIPSILPSMTQITTNPIFTSSFKPPSMPPPLLQPPLTPKPSLSLPPNPPSINQPLSPNPWTDINPNNPFLHPELDPRSTTTLAQCGLSNTNKINKLIVNGDTTTYHEFPWLAALFRRYTPNDHFICTANLVSQSHVVTAGHCVQYYKVLLLPQKDLFLILGAWDLSNWSEQPDAQKRTIAEIKVHPAYKQGSAHGDVAVLKLNVPVEFSYKIRPICLWSGNRDLSDIEGMSGVVSGWGTDGQKTSTSEPKKVVMPIVSQDTCSLSADGLSSLTSEMTFCAGSQNGAGPCLGDSGAGFILKTKNQETYQLRGVVSNALKDKDLSCDLYNYIVFADIAKLIDFVQNAIAN